MTTKITKNELVELIANENNLSKAETNRLLNSISTIITNSLAEGNQVAFPGLFTAKVTVRKERKGRNPRTGEEITIAERKAISFSTAKALKDSLN